MLEAELIRGLTEGGIDVVRGRHGPLAHALFRHSLSRRRRRHPGHRQPQPGGLQRLQDAAEGPLGLRRRKSRRSAERAARGHWSEGAGTSNKSTSARPMSTGCSKAFRANAYRIGWDAGNGAAGPVLEMLVERLPGRAFHDAHRGRRHLPRPPPRPDGRSEPRRPEAASSHDRQLDFGIAFDGDADRIGAVDGKGRVIWGDQLLVDPRRAGAEGAARRHDHRRREGEPGAVRPRSPNSAASR